MTQECTTCFIAGVIVGIIAWEMIQAIARAIFLNRSKILAFIIIMLAVLGVVLTVRIVVDPCMLGCVVPGVTATPGP